MGYRRGAHCIAPDKALALIAALHDTQNSLRLGVLESRVKILHDIIRHKRLMHLRNMRHVACQTDSSNRGKEYPASHDQPCSTVGCKFEPAHSGVVCVRSQADAAQHTPFRHALRFRHAPLHKWQLH